MAGRWPGAASGRVCSFHRDITLCFLVLRVLSLRLDVRAQQSCLQSPSSLSGIAALPPTPWASLSPLLAWREGALGWMSFLSSICAARPAWVAGGPPGLLCSPCWPDELRDSRTKEPAERSPEGEKGPHRPGRAGSTVGRHGQGSCCP